MNFREVLMTNKMKFLEDNLEAISEQLILLQDFLKQEFGMKFTRFFKSPVTPGTTRKTSHTPKTNNKGSTNTSSLCKLRRSSRSTRLGLSANRKSKEVDEDSASEKSFSSGSEYHIGEDDEDSKSSGSVEEVVMYNALDDQDGSYIDDITIPKCEPESPNPLLIPITRGTRSQDDTNESIVFEIPVDVHQRMSQRSGPVLTSSINRTSTEVLQAIPTGSVSSVLETIDFTSFFPDNDGIEIEIAVSQSQSQQDQDEGDVASTAGQDEMSTKRKRRGRGIKVGTPFCERKMWKQKRLKGEEHTRRVKKDGEMVTVHLPARKLGTRCKSKVCQKVSRIHCKNFSEATRQNIFNNLWKNMTWEQRKVYSVNLIDIIQCKQRKTGDDSRRQFTYVYHLDLDGQRTRVCRSTFLGTLGIGRQCLSSWVDKAVKSTKS